MGQPRSLFNLFLSFQTHITNFTTNRYVKKCPSCIPYWDSNSRPLEHESSPITTRPEPPPKNWKFVDFEIIDALVLHIVDSLWSSTLDSQHHPAIYRAKSTLTGTFFSTRHLLFPSRLAIFTINTEVS